MEDTSREGVELGCQRSGLGASGVGRFSYFPRLVPQTTHLHSSNSDKITQQQPTLRLHCSHLNHVVEATPIMLFVFDRGGNQSTHRGPGSHNQ